VYIGGEQLARGYHDRPDVTAAAFVPDPFGPEPGGRLYRSGDLARWLPDGNVEFLGRSDTQVKVRGHRIELGEVEAALAGHEAVAEAAVTARDDLPGGRYLAAYVVAAPGRHPETLETALRSYLKERLPGPMVPATFVRMESLPRLDNGKLDREGLPAPDLRSVSPSDSVPPATPIEELIAGVWADLLGMETVGADDDFFGLGGHSLLAAQAVARLRGLLHVDLTLRDLLEEPTVAGLAGRLEAVGREADGRPAVPPVRRRDRDGPLPLSSAQSRLWFIDQLHPGSAAYSIPIVLRIRGGLDEEALRGGLSEIVRRHEALRTTFAAVDGTPVQIIAAPQPLDLSPTDLTDRPADRRPDEAQRLIAAEARRGFDLAAGPLFRVRLLRLGPRDHVLVLAVHHIVFDGRSTEVFFTELDALYRAYSHGRGSPLPEPPLQYADYALWEQERLQDGSLEPHLAFWMQRLGDAGPPLDLPLDHPRPSLPTVEGALLSDTLPRPLGDALRHLGRRQGATLFMVLLAAFYTLLHRLTGRTDIVVGTAVANRDRTETQGIIGLLANTLALRADLAGNPRFDEFLQRVRRNTLQAYAHQEAPFDRLVDELRPRRASGHTPLFPVMFDLHAAPPQPPELAGLDVEPLEVDTGTAKFDFNVEVTDGPDGLDVQVYYNTGLFAAPTMRRLLADYRSLLERVAADPGERVSPAAVDEDIVVLRPEELDELFE